MTDAEPSVESRAERRVNWEAIRERLAASAEALASADAADASGQAVLDARARALARPLDSARSGPPGDADAGHVLVVRVGAARYALPVTGVVEIARTDGLTPLPGAEPPAVAVLAWRGRMLTVLDLHSAPGGAARPLTEHARVVVVGERRATVGLAVDAVEEIRALAANAVHPGGPAGGPPGRGAGMAHAVVGVTADAMAVLDVGALARGMGTEDSPGAR